MLANLKLYLGGFILLVIGGLLAAVKVQSKRLDSAKKDIERQKVHTKAAAEAARTIAESEEKTKEAMKVHEKISSTSADDDRDWLLNRHHGSDHGNKDQL